MLRNLILMAGLILCLAACGGGGTPSGTGGFDAGAFEKELAALELPEGVDPVLWENLKQNLRDAVLAEGEHTSSSVPGTEQETVADLIISALHEDGSIELDWGYINFGDYNQDKLVNVNDLTPIGIYFGYTEEHEDWPRARYADGNRDGQVGIGDITLLGVNYLQRVEGYQVGYDPTEPAAFVLQEGEVLFDDSYIDEETFQRRFSYTVAEPVDGAYYMVRPYDGDQTGHASNAVKYQLTNPDIIVTVPSGMQGGVDAQWAAAWSRGTAPFTITWEFGGGADDFGMYYSANPTKRTFEMVNDSRTEPADYHYVVTVEDRHGFTGVAEGDYSVGPNPHPLVTVAVPDDMLGGVDSTWKLAWVGGEAPFEVDLNFGGGSFNNTEPDVQDSFYEYERIMFNPSLTDERECSYTFTVTDANGLAGTATGVYQIAPQTLPVINITVPDMVKGGETALWVAEFSGGTRPYHIFWAFDGGGELEANNDWIQTSPVEESVLMVNLDPVNEAEYTYTVTIQDQFNHTGVAEGEYTVGPGPNYPPVLELAYYDCINQTATLTVSDPNANETITAQITEPDGFHVDALTKQVTGGEAQDIVFNWTVDLPVDGRCGSSGVILTDAYGGETNGTVQLLMPLPDTLYAVPLKSNCEVDEPFTVQLLTGATTNPFRYVPSIYLSCNGPMEYIYESGNAGVPGGNEDDADGLWSQMAVPPSGFQIFEVARMTDGTEAEEVFEIILAPQGGSDLAGAYGGIVNAEFTFSAPGVYDLRFQDTYDGIPRTYYEDWDEYTYAWADRTNVHDGLITTITVE